MSNFQQASNILLKNILRNKSGLIDEDFFLKGSADWLTSNISIIFRRNTDRDLLQKNGFTDVKNDSNKILTHFGSTSGKIIHGILTYTNENFEIKIIYESASRRAPVSNFFAIEKFGDKNFIISASGVFVTKLAPLCKYIAKNTASCQKYVKDDPEYLENSDTGTWLKEKKLSGIFFNRYRRRLETCPQAKTSKSGHAIFHSFFRRVRATSMTRYRTRKTNFW